MHVHFHLPNRLQKRRCALCTSISDGSTPPLVGNDFLLPWCSPIHLYPGDCWMEIPSRGINAKLMVTTSNHVLVNMADFGDDLEIERDVLAAKRCHEDDDTSGGESDGTSGTSASTVSDAHVVPEKRRRRRVDRKPRPPRKKNSFAFIQLSPSLQSELKKLQQVATRGSGVSKAKRDKVCTRSHPTVAT